MNPTQLSININKYALLRNSRGRGIPDLCHVIDTVLGAGAHGITVHPRRDQRHIRYDDLPVIARHLAEHHPGVELNIECENHPEVLQWVERIRPQQCTLVPVRPGEVTSDHGYRFPEDMARLMPTLDRLRELGIRSSLFVESRPEDMRYAREAGADRIELYTGPFAWACGKPEGQGELQKLIDTSQAADEAGLGVNAGHDLDRHNLFELRMLPRLDEVSIGHAQICRALDVGTTQSVQELLSALGVAP